MGVDYKWGSSAGGIRFFEETKRLATKVFGAEFFENRKSTERYRFPEGTHPSIVKFFSCAYGPLTVEETKSVWEEFQKHPEIKEIMPDMWHEFEMDARYDEEFRLSY